MNKVAHLVAINLLSLIAPLNAEEAQKTLLPDPTRPFGAAAPLVKPGTEGQSPTEAAFVLQAIIKSNNNRKAMINGSWVVENQIWHGAKIMKIHEYSVVLSTGGRTRLLNLQPAIITHSTLSGEH